MCRWSIGPLFTVVWLVACGADETLIRPSPEPGSGDAGLDPCDAFDTFLSVRGVPERLCALNQPAGDEGSAQRCALCAAGLNAVSTLLPDLSCPTELDDCPVEHAALNACFKDVGQLVTEALPGCTDTSATLLDPAALALRFATSNCGPVIAECPPVQELVFALLGAAL